MSVVEKLTIGDFKRSECEDFNFGAFELSDAELTSVGHLKLRVIKARKDGRLRAVLLPNKLYTIIKIVVDSHSNVDHLNGNPFIFSLPGTKNKTLNGQKAMKAMARECGCHLAECCNLMKSVRLS